MDRLAGVLHVVLSGRPRQDTVRDAVLFKGSAGHRGDGELGSFRGFLSMAGKQLIKDSVFGNGRAAGECA